MTSIPQTGASLHDPTIGLEKSNITLTDVVSELVDPGRPCSERSIFQEHPETRVDIVQPLTKGSPEPADGASIIEPEISTRRERSEISLESCLEKVQGIAYEPQSPAKPEEQSVKV